MNRNDAKTIAKTITNEQLQDMLNRAQSEIKDWTKTSICNKGCTKGTAWNILGKGFDLNQDYHILAKNNMVREFGEYLPESLKPVKHKEHLSAKPPVHQDPLFDWPIG